MFLLWEKEKQFSPLIYENDYNACTYATNLSPRSNSLRNMPKLVNPGEKSSTSPGLARATAASNACFQSENTLRTGSLTSCRSNSARSTGNSSSVPLPASRTTSRQHSTIRAGHCSSGKPATPIDFQAIDGRPVTIIWLLNSPPDKTGPHIHALARISRLMTIEKFRQSLNAATQPQEVFDIIAEQESQL